MAEMTRPASAVQDNVTRPPSGASAHVLPSVSGGGGGGGARPGIGIGLTACSSQLPRLWSLSKSGVRPHHGVAVSSSVTHVYFKFDHVQG
jgi:hypothetical protein